MSNFEHLISSYYNQGLINVDSEILMSRVVCHTSEVCFYMTVLVFDVVVVEWFVILRQFASTEGVEEAVISTERDEDFQVL